jgi:peptide/nickel transport system substrate-binding protein
LFPRWSVRPTRIGLAAVLVAALAASGCVSREARFGSVLIFGKSKDAVKLDPAEVNEGESSAVTQNIYDTLVAFKPGATTIVPALAERWAVSPDGLRYTFTLRPHVRFHDGTVCDAAAVKYNFDRQKDPKHPGHTGTYEYWLNFFDPVVKRVEAPNATTVVITLNAPDATFLSNMALFSMGIVSPAAIAKWGKDIVRHPVGTGPFRFVTWVPTQKIILDANPDYWGGRPKLDKLVFKPIPENSVRLLELENGSISGMSGINPDDVARIQRHPALSLRTGPGMNVGYMALNMTKKPLDDVRVRRAIAHAIDKQAMVKAFFAGGTLGMAAKNPLPPSVWGYNDAVKDYTYDPAEAKRLLKEAGLPNGFKLTLWALPVARPYMPQGQRTAEAIQADLERVGIDVTITTFEWGTYLDKLSKGDHQAALIGWNGDNGDPDNFLYTLLDANNARAGSASNYSFYKGQAVHELLTKARRVPDQASRTALYERAQLIIHDDAPMVPLFHSTQLVAFRKDVTGFVVSPMSDMFFEKVTFTGAPAHGKR